MRSDESISLSNLDINILSSLAQNTTLDVEQKVEEARANGASEDAIQVLRYIADPFRIAETAKQLDAVAAAADFLDWLASVKRST